MIEVSLKEMWKIWEELKAAEYQLENACCDIGEIRWQFGSMEEFAGNDEVRKVLCSGLKRKEQEMRQQRYEWQSMVQTLEIVLDLYESCENRVCMLSENEGPFHSISLKCNFVPLEAAKAFLKQWNLGLYL